MLSLGRRLILCLRSCHFLISFVFSPQSQPAAFQIQSDLLHGMCFLSSSPSCGFSLLTWRLYMRAKRSTSWPSNSTTTTRTTLNGCFQHLALSLFSPCSCSTGMWLTVGWLPLPSGTLSFSAFLHVWGVRGVSHPPLWPYPSRLRLLLLLLFHYYLLSWVPWRSTASPGPALSWRCRLLRSAVFSLALLSQFLPRDGRLVSSCC